MVNTISKIIRRRKVLVPSQEIKSTIFEPAACSRKQENLKKNQKQRETKRNSNLRNVPYKPEKCSKGRPLPNKKPDKSREKHVSEFLTKWLISPVVVQLLSFFCVFQSCPPKEWILISATVMYRFSRLLKIRKSKRACLERSFAGAEI